MVGRMMTFFSNLLENPYKQGGHHNNLF